MFIMLSLLSLWIAIVLFAKNGAPLHLRKLNFCTYVFFYEFLAQSFIASLLVVYKLDGHYIISSVASDKTRVLGWAAVQWCMIGMGFGLSVGRFFTKKRFPNKYFRLYTERPITVFSDDYEFCIKILLVILSGLSLLATIYYCFTIGGISLVRVIKNPLLMHSSLRGDIARHYQGVEYIKNIFSIGLSPILAYIWCVYAYHKNSFSNKVIFFFMLLNALIALTNNLAKGPVCFFLLNFLFLYVLIHSKIKLKYIGVAAISVLGIVIVIYIFLLNVPFKHLFNYNSGILGRIILSQSAGTYCSFEYFPRYHEHLGFSSFPEWLTNAFGLAHSERSARICMELFNPQGVAFGTAGVINSLFIAEAWANWGIIGLIIAPIFVGIFIQLLFFSLLRLPKHPITLGFIAYFSTNLPITGGINDFIYPISFFIFITFLYLIFYGAHILKYSLSGYHKCKG